MTNGASQTYVVTLTVPLTPTASLTPTVTTASPTPDNEPTNNTGTSLTDPLWPDLVVDVSDGVTWISKGDELIYVIVVRNDGTRTAENSVLTMTLPASVTLDATSDGGVPSGEQIVWSLGNIEPGETYTRYVTMTVASSLPPTLGGLLAPVTVESPSGDLNPTDNAAEDLDYVNGNTLSDLQVTLTESPDPVAPGGVIVYTITVQNLGPNAAEGVSLTFDLPDGLIPGGIVPTQTSGTDPLIWDIGTMSNGGVRIYVVTATVPLTMSGPLTATALVGGTTLDPDLTNNTDAEGTTLTGPDLVTTVDDGVDTAGPGDVLVYEIVVRNDGTDPAANSALTFTLPASTTLGTASNGGAASGGLVVWPLGEMSPGEVVTRYVTVTVSPNLPPTVSSLTATATAQSPSGDSNPTNNTDTDVDANEALTADLQVTLTESPDPVAPGSPLVYTIIVTNNGVLPAENVTPTQSSGTDPLVWNVGTVPSGTVRTYVVTVTVAPTATGPLTPTAVVASTTPDPNPSNNTDTESTTLGDPDLVLTVRPSTTSIRPGDTISYFVTLTNTGDAPITDSVVTATIPLGARFNPNASTPGWTCTPDNTAGSVCTFPVGGLDPSEVDDLVFALDVLDELPPGTTNFDVRFRATGDNGDPVSAVVDDATVVVTYPALEVFMTATPPAGTSVAPGDPITYRVTITSVGTVTATGVVITAPVPAGANLVPGSSTPTPVRTNPIVWQLGDLPPGEVREVVYVIETDPATGQTSVIAVVQAAADDVAPVDSNLMMHPLAATAIELERLELVAVDGGIEIRWQIAAMQNSLGFHIWRSSNRDEASSQRVTPSLIPARSIGAYSWTDTSGTAASYYWLEEIDMNGTTVRYGPVSLQTPVFAGPVQAQVNGLVAVPRIAAGNVAVEVLAPSPRLGSSAAVQAVELRPASADMPAAAQESAALVQVERVVAAGASSSDAVTSEPSVVAEAANAAETVRQGQPAAPRTQPQAIPAQSASANHAESSTEAGVPPARSEPQSEAAPPAVASKAMLPGLLLIGIAGIVALLGAAGAVVALFVIGARRR